jgi:hypothetical protein
MSEIIDVPKIAALDNERAKRKPEKLHNKTNSHGHSQILITLRGGKLDENTTKAETALIAAGAPFYVRDCVIVRPIIEEVPAAKGGKTRIARLRPITAHTLRDHLSRAMKFEKYDARSRKYIEVDPPFDIANTLMAREGEWQFPALAGVITTPTMRPDGSILSEPGYDSATKLLLVEPPPMPEIPERPSRDDALAAVAKLDALLNEFPFVNKASRSVALSALMTPVARGAMAVAPMHAANAPEPGSGKSYIFDVAAAIATGEKCPAMAAGRNEEETEKRLVAELLTAQPIISIDNLNGDVDGDFICQAIERPIIKARILGRSETRRIVNTFTLFGNGNNFRVTGDIVRRVILCTMDANLEQPWLREFRGDPVAAVLDDRGAYIAAVLIIVRSYLTAGCPDRLPALASFEDWSRLIRSALVWLGHVDPVDTMEAARADDPSRNNLRAVISAWQIVIGTNKPLTAGDLKNAACGTGDKDLLLNKAISAVACANGRSEIDPQRLGHWLGRNKGRVVDGIKIAGDKDKHTKQTVWSLVESATDDVQQR